MGTREKLQVGEGKGEVGGGGGEKLWGSRFGEDRETEACG